MCQKSVKNSWLAWVRISICILHWIVLNGEHHTSAGGPFLHGTEATGAKRAFIPFFGKGWHGEGIFLPSTIDVTVASAAFLYPSCSYTICLENLRLKTTLNTFFYYLKPRFKSWMLKGHHQQINSSPFPFPWYLRASHLFWQSNTNCCHPWGKFRYVRIQVAPT